VRELPDYIPLYLEYLASREDAEAREGLADVEHLLALLAARLDERNLIMPPVCVHCCRSRVQMRKQPLKKCVSR
jgi:nitrate reductase delta subunit